MSFYQEGRKVGTFEDGIEMALRRILASPEFLVRVEKEPANLAAGKAIALVTWNWPLVCRFSSGAVSRTMN